VLRLGSNALEHLSECLQGRVPKGADWELIIGSANENFIGPLLNRRLVQSDQVAQVDPDALVYLAELDAANIGRNHRLKKQLHEVITVLTAQDIEVGLTKGAVLLFQSSLVDTVPRMSFDLDIVTNPNDDEAVTKVLSDIGYMKFPDSQNQYSLGSYYRDDVVGALDVHNRIPERYFDTITEQDLQEQSRMVPFGNGAVRIPNASLRLVTNLSHDMLQDRGVFTGFTQLRYVLELIDLCSIPGDPIDWPWVENKFSNHRFKLGLELQCRMVSYLFTDVAFPVGPRTTLGWCLHQRRVLRSRLPTLAGLEWQVILKIRRSRFWVWLRRPK